MEELLSTYLVIDFNRRVVDKLEEAGNQVVYIDSMQELEKQVKIIIDNKPYNRAVVLPRFAAQQSNIGTPEGWGDLKKTFSEDWLIAYAVNALVSDGMLVALVPNGLLSNYGRQATRKGLIDRGLVLVANMPIGAQYNGIDISDATLILVSMDNKKRANKIVFYDHLDEENVSNLHEWKRFVSNPRESSNQVKGVTTVPTQALGDDLRLDPQYYDSAYLQIKAPKGYLEAIIGEIAEIKGGVSIPKESREFEKKEGLVPYIQVRHITTDGTFADHLLWVDSGFMSESKRAIPGDILITIAGTVGKVAVVPGNYEKGVLFDTSIRRVRVQDANISIESIVEFLRSDLGQLQFQRMTGGTAIPQITSPILSSMRVFIPEGDGQSQVSSVGRLQEISAAKTQASVIADAIESQVTGHLRNVTGDDPSWRQRFEEALRSISARFLTKTLSEAVLQDYPAPIAIPYRRFQMARYNHYEYLDRMVSLVESCVYFIYHVLFADYCHYKLYGKITLSNDALQACKGRQSIDYRLKFIAELIEAANSGKISLFMPEIVNCQIVDVGNRFREEVRNPIAHSAPGSEPYIQSLTNKYLPYVELLLESIRFLDQYTLCRIRSHTYHKSRWSYQAEIYRGAEYDFNIQESNGTVVLNEEGSGLIEAEREHLVLLNADNEILDMHPFYQLYFGSETCRESHLCFFKYRQDSKLLGESIRSGLEVELSGIDSYKKLANLK